MTMQTDVRQARLYQSGWMISGPARVKGTAMRGGTGDGYVAFFDTATVPVTASYAQSGTTVTVTKTAHGLNTGDSVGISYLPGTGGAATSGNYTVTKLTADTFSITDPNSNSVTAGAVCYYVAGGEWMFSLSTKDGDIYINYFPIPGEGVHASTKVYALISSLDVVSAFYG